MGDAEQVEEANGEAKEPGGVRTGRNPGGEGSTVQPMKGRVWITALAVFGGVIGAVLGLIVLALATAPGESARLLDVYAFSLIGATLGGFGLIGAWRQWGERFRSKTFRSGCTATVAAIMGLAWAFVGPLGRPKPFQRGAFEAVVAQIQSGALKSDRHGVVVLPRDCAALTATGRVYVSRGAEGGLLVLFPAWVGRQALLISPIDLSGDSWLEAYIYSSRPDDGGPVLGPPAETYWRAVHDQRTVEWDLWTAQQISEHWQYAYPFS